MISFMACKCMRNLMEDGVFDLEVVEVKEVL
jgi:hypothetical protein